MEKIKNGIITLLIAIVFISCGSKHNDPDVTRNPTASLLIFPDKDAACIIGSNVSSTESTVQFSWQSATIADRYELTIKDLLTGNTVTKVSSKPQLDVALSLNTPYSWFVVSKVNGSNSSAKSDTWRFYNSGPGVSSYAPFPAEITYPVMEQKIPAGEITLTWNGKDIDNDIVGYDVYFGTSAYPSALKTGIVDNKLTGVSVTSKTSYYWRVVTKDSKGNISDSRLYTFTVN